MKRATSVIPAGERANRAVMLPSGLLLQPVASDSCYLSEPGTPIIGAGAAGSVHRWWRQEAQLLQPYAVKQYHFKEQLDPDGPGITCARKEANVLRYVQGLPGVTQGEGLVAGSENHVVMRFMRGCSLETVVTHRINQPYDCKWMRLLTKQLCLVTLAGCVNSYAPTEDKKAPCSSVWCVLFRLYLDSMRGVWHGAMLQLAMYS
ncbi:hypothetical protein ABBQ38_014192 [Trebouxia sp. C0009 RCD-2024]